MGVSPHPGADHPAHGGVLSLQARHQLLDGLLEEVQGRHDDHGAGRRRAAKAS
ncbi:hypothetical protein [Streptomyces sp. NPDC057838]|uniref:hypothetical protein n=1 Tax=unclassified Streptomyces TaxID=2593676 RepID=UPI0036836BD8